MPMLRTIAVTGMLLLTGAASAHHTKDHILGAPTPPEPIAANVAQDGNDDASWLALGPFAVLATLGALRWGYRRRQDKNKNARD